MVNSLIQFVVRQFAGKIAAAIASGILFGVLKAFSEIAAKSPEIAATINPQEVAGWLAALAIALLNIAANKWHLDQTTVQTVEDALKAAPPVVSVKAEPVNDPAKPYAIDHQTIGSD